MNFKLKILINNFTWTETVSLKDTNLILNKWIFNTKYILTEKIE